jgi:hypothetical protein
MSLVTSGCGLTVLSNGQISTMESEDNSLRTSLAIASVPLPIELSYLSTGTCLYDQTIAIVNGPRTDRQTKITIRPVRNYVYFAFDHGDGRVSGYLIDHVGKIYSYNSQQITSSEACTPETRERLDRDILAQARANKPIFSGDAHVIDDFPVEFPQYIRESLMPGDVAAYVRSEGGGNWGRYRYVGITDYHGVRAAVFDLTRDPPPGSTLRPLLVGFNIVDIRTAMPLYVGFKLGSTIQFRQIACS